jgi:hypothetical protein
MAKSAVRIDASDRRRSPRQEVTVDAAIVSSETRVSVTILDLSVEGCGIKVISKLKAGSRLRLVVSGWSWPCTVLWSEPGRAGLSFDHPMHRGIVNITLGGRSKELVDYLQLLMPPRFVRRD